MSIIRTDALRRSQADQIYSAQGHGHSDISAAITVVSESLTSHVSGKAHVDYWYREIPVSDLGEAIAPFPWTATGYVVSISAYAKTAPTGSAATFTVKAASAWSGTPVEVAQVSIAAGAYAGSQATITSGAVVGGGIGTITVDADSGATCADAYVVISVRVDETANPGEEPLLGRQVSVSWTFNTEDEADIDRFEILEDGNLIWQTATVSARSASIFMYWDKVYSLRAASGTDYSELAPQLVAIFQPALAAEPGVVATASSSRTAVGIERVPSFAIDGRATTYWWSEAGETAWYKLDLGAQRSITGYRLHMGENRPVDWVFETSDDDVTYTAAHTVADDTGGEVYIKTGLSVSARYVRWSLTESTFADGYLLREVEVTGS